MQVRLECLLLLLLLIRPYPVFYLVCLSSYDVQSSHQLEVLQVARRCLAFHSLRFLQAGYHPSYLHDLFMLVSSILVHFMTS